MSTPPNSTPLDKEVLSQLRRLSRRGFAVYAAGLGAMVLGIRWVGTQSESAGISWPLRYMQEVNEKVWHGLVGTGGLAPEFPRSEARDPRSNGQYGIIPENTLNAADWRLRVESDAGHSIAFTLDQLKALPRVEQVTEFKCIEGWSEIVEWAGCRFSDFAKFARQGTRSNIAMDGAAPRDFYSYVSLSSVNGGYYVGIDISSALHPQTLLAYEMNGSPLTTDHGAPLRLVIPVKYGIKNIKQIGTIRFTDKRPSDYWAERGYDWYAGL